MHATARHSEVEKGGTLETASCLVRIIPCFRVEGMMQYGAFVPLAAFTAQACSCEHKRWACDRGTSVIETDYMFKLLC